MHLSDIHQQALFMWFEDTNCLHPIFSPEPKEKFV